MLKIVFRVVSCTIDNMRNADVLKHLLISCDNVASKPHESINYFRADSFIKFIFIFFSRSSFEVEVFII